MRRGIFRRRRSGRKLVGVIDFPQKDCCAASAACKQLTFSLPGIGATCRDDPQGIESGLRAIGRQHRGARLEKRAVGRAAKTTLVPPATRITWEEHRNRR